MSLLKKVVLYYSLFIAATFVYAQDWVNIPIPADPGLGKKWELQENVSDDFSYSSPKTPKSDDFLNKWDDYYHANWSGPGLTIWRRENSLVENGMLTLTANRTGTNKVNLGCIHSNNTVQYPVYIEGRAKVINSVLACALWLLSPDDTQEIDFMEGYGSSYSEGALNDLTWFAERMHMSHHVFIRSPFTDWQPKDETSPGYPTWITVKKGGSNILWRNGYHTYGVYWKDPWHLYYYIDGVLVTKKEGKDQIDPLFHTNSVSPGDTKNDTRTGLSKPMDIIIDSEDQDWRSNQKITPTNTELSNVENNTFRVDWIRAYKPITDPNYVPLNTRTINTQLRLFPNPAIDVVKIESVQQVTNVIIYGISGAVMKLEIVKDDNLSIVSLRNVAPGTYIIKVQTEDGMWYSEKISKL